MELRLNVNYPGYTVYILNDGELTEEVVNFCPIPSLLSGARSIFALFFQGPRVRGAATCGDLGLSVGRFLVDMI